MYLGTHCPFEQFVINSISKYFTLITKLVYTIQFKVLLQNIFLYLQLKMVIIFLLGLV